MHSIVKEAHAKLLEISNNKKQYKTLLTDLTVQVMHHPSRNTLSLHQAGRGWRGRSAIWFYSSLTRTFCTAGCGRPTAITAFMCTHCCSQVECRKVMPDIPSQSQCDPANEQCKATGS